jgi:hypothetical protein
MKFIVRNDFASSETAVLRAHMMCTVAPQPLRQSLSNPASKHWETVSKSSSGSMSA